MIGSSTDETSFTTYITTKRKTSFKAFKAFTNNSSANMKLSETQLPKIVQSGECLDGFLGPLISNGFNEKCNYIIS